MPGNFQPHEAVVPSLSPAAGASRFVLHANGRVGDPSRDLELGAAYLGARIVVCTSQIEWLSAPADQRRMALQLALALPTLSQLKRSRLNELYQTWDPQLWVPATLVAEHATLPADRWSAPDTDAWAVVAPSPDHVLIMAGTGIDPQLVHTRVVTDWEPYRIDLTQPRTAAEIATSMSQAEPSWT